MSAVATSSLKRDMGLIAWQIRYEQRAYWRNRGRGGLHVRVPADVPGDLRLAQPGSAHLELGRDPLHAFFVPGILAYGVIATTFVNMAISTAILATRGC
jgi:hypothetical protein